MRLKSQLLTAPAGNDTQSCRVSCDLQAQQLIHSTFGIVLHFFAKSFSILFVRYPYGFVDSRHYSQQTRNSNMAAQAERRYYEEESFHCNTIEDSVLSHYRRQ